MITPKKWKIFSIIALIVSFIASGYGIYGILMFNGFNQLTKLYSEIPETPDIGHFNIASIQFMNCKTKGDVAKICSENIEGQLDWFMNILIFVVIFITISFAFQLIDFYVSKKRIK